MVRWSDNAVALGFAPSALCPLRHAPAAAGPTVLDAVCK